MATQVEILMRTEGKPNGGDSSVTGSGGGKDGTTKELEGQGKNQQTAAQKMKDFQKAIQSNFKGVGSWLRKNIGLQFTMGAALKQSQVFTNFMGTIYQLVGALVDVILAPLLPLFFPLVRMLASAIPYIQVGMEKFMLWVESWMSDARALWDSWWPSIEKKWEEFKAVWDEGIASVLAWVTAQLWGAAKWVGEWVLNTALPWLWEQIKGWGDSIWQWFQGLSLRAKGWIIQALMFGWNIITGVGKVLWTFKGAILKWLGKSFLRILGWAIKLPFKIAGSLFKVAGFMLKAFLPGIGHIIVWVSKLGATIVKGIMKAAFSIVKFLFNLAFKVVKMVVKGVFNSAKGLVKTIVEKFSVKLGKLPIIGGIFKGLGKATGFLKVAAKASKAIPVLGSVATLGFGVAETISNTKKYGLKAGIATGAKTLAATGLAATGNTVASLAVDIGGSALIDNLAKKGKLGTSGTYFQEQAQSQNTTNVKIVTNTEETVYEQTITTQERDSEHSSDVSRYLSGNAQT